MAYTKTTWKDRVVDNPRTFDMQQNPDSSVTLIPKPGTVHEAGTPVNATNMNKAEQGIADAHTIAEGKVSKAGDTMTGALTAPVVNISSNGESLKIVGTDHAYMGLYPKGAAQGRKAYIGYPDSGAVDVTIINSMTNGGINLGSNGAGKVKANGHEVWSAGNDGPFVRDRGTIPGNQNWNNLIEPGFYSFGDTVGMTNSPGDAWGILEVIRPSSSSYIVQRATYIISGKTVQRVRTEATAGWNAWFVVWNSGSDGSGSGLDADTVRGYVPFNRNGDTVQSGMGVKGWVQLYNDGFSIIDFYNWAGTQRRGYFGMDESPNGGLVFYNILRANSFSFSDEMYINGHKAFHAGNRDAGAKIIPIYSAGTFVYSSSPTYTTVVTHQNGTTVDLDGYRVLWQSALAANRTVYFEAIMRASSGTAFVFINHPGASGAGLTTTSTSFTRVRTGAIQGLQDNNELVIKLSGSSGTTYLAEARIVII